MKKDKQKINEILKRIKKTVRNTKKFIPLHEPLISRLDVNSVQNCVKSTFVSSTGKNVINFEKKIKKITNSKNVISVVNGTCGLHLSLKILGVDHHLKQLLFHPY